MTSTKTEVAPDSSREVQPELSTTLEKEELHVVQPTPYEEESSEVKDKLKNEERGHDNSEAAKAYGEANGTKGRKDAETAKEESTEVGADGTADAAKASEESNGAKEDKADQSKTEEITATA